jgi:ribosomal protein S18 acetylase RimI-like enzyme
VIEQLSAGEVVVRRARTVDYDDIGRLSVAAYRQDGQLTTAGHYAAVLADVASRAAAGEVFVAHDREGLILGSVTLVLPGTPYAELSGPGEAEFRMLAVDPAAQGRGVGEALVRACVRRASELSATALVICVRDFAEPARRLYARLGFLRAPERDWQPLPDVTLLALRLPL